MWAERKEILRERNSRLGIDPLNIKKRGIRIAPMKGSSISPGLLASKLDCVKEWITITLRKARLSSTLSGVNVVASIEKPMCGDPFEVLWAEFDFGNDMFDDQVMWDIRYLLMGSKLGKIPGFPCEMEEIRNKIFISRDGDSERVRKNCGS